MNGGSGNAKVLGNVGVDCSPKSTRAPVGTRLLGSRLLRKSQFKLSPQGGTSRGMIKCTVLFLTRFDDDSEHLPTGHSPSVRHLLGACELVSSLEGVPG